MVGGAGIQPIVTFQPLVGMTSPESEGPALIAIAPPAFPSPVNDGAFIGFHGQPAYGIAVHGDRRLLRRMISNLLENARRHGAPPIAVRVRGAGDTVELRVCDHGPGIPDAEREKVFRPFHRFTRSGEATGSGLGLTLVAQIATRHGGEARYVGRHQEESCFVVTLKAVSTTEEAERGVRIPRGGCPADPFRDDPARRVSGAGSGRGV